MPYITNEVSVILNLGHFEESNQKAKDEFHRRCIKLEKNGYEMVDTKGNIDKRKITYRKDTVI